MLIYLNPSKRSKIGENCFRKREIGRAIEIKVYIFMIRRKVRNILRLLMLKSV